MKKRIQIVLDVPHVPLIKALIESHPRKDEILSKLLEALASGGGSVTPNLVPISQRQTAIVSPLLVPTIEKGGLHNPSPPIAVPISRRTTAIVSPILVPTIEKSILHADDYVKVVETYFHKNQTARLRNADIRRNCGGSANQARHAVRKLIDQDIIESQGERKSTVYFLKGQLLALPEVTEVSEVKLLKPEIDWHNQPLGQVSDNSLAKILGCAQSTVRVNRETLGIPVCQTKTKTKSKEIDWDAQPLGTESDYSISKSLGVSPKIVGRKRKERDIEAFAVFPGSLKKSAAHTPPKKSPLIVPPPVIVKSESSSFGEFPPVIDESGTEVTLADKDVLLQRLLST